MSILHRFVTVVGKGFTIVSDCCCCSVTKLCLLICDPMDCSLPGSSTMEFRRQEYWSRLPFPSPENLPDPWIKPMSLALAGRFFTTASPGKPIAEWGSGKLGDQAVWVEILSMALTSQVILKEFLNCSVVQDLH